MLHLVKKSLVQQTGAFPRDGVSRDTVSRDACHARRTAARRIAASLALALCAGPANAEDPPSPDDLARATVEEAATANEAADEVRKLSEHARGEADAVGGNELEEFARSVVADALVRADAAASMMTGGAAERTGENAGPLPAELHLARAAGGLAGRQDGLAARQGTAEVLVFLSLAVPEAGWAQWSAQAARAGVPLVLRGVAPAGLRSTAAEVRRRLGGHEAGVAIDPRLFKLFGVERVPAVVAVPGGVPACASRGCADDAPPPFDTVGGNIGLVAALEAIASEGDAAREIARRHLERFGRQR